MRSNSIISTTFALVSVACASSQAEEVRDARNEKIDERTVAETRAVELREEARIDKIERNHDAAKNVVLTSGRFDEKSAKRVIDIHEQRSTYEAKAAARHETIGVRIKAARDKLAVLGSRAPEGLRRRLSAVEDEHMRLEPAVRDLPATAPVNWEAAAESLDYRLSELNARVKRLTVAIQDQDV
jgi:hypothetical protein